MNEDATHNFIIRFLYGETSKSENILVADKLASDIIFCDIYNELRAVYNALDSVKMRSPNSSSVQIILNHSKSIALEQMM